MLGVALIHLLALMLLLTHRDVIAASVAAGHANLNPAQLDGRAHSLLLQSAIPHIVLALVLTARAQALSLGAAERARSSPACWVSKFSSTRRCRSRSPNCPGTRHCPRRPRHLTRARAQRTRTALDDGIRPRHLRPYPTQLITRPSTTRKTAITEPLEDDGLRRSDGDLGRLHAVSGTRRGR